MTASLVSLFQPRHGWTNEERAQFARIERLLEDAGFAVDVEHGLSDEGEPWCVFCSRQTGDVIIHVACIDGRFMFDSSTLPRPIEGASFTRCAERFFEDVALPMPLAQRRDRVLLHPSALLASLFITILLYAQATTEQQLFDVEPVDVDDPEAAPQLSPMALRIRAIAQQVADYVAGSENAQSAAQAYVNPAMAAIPAGMALAVIAIAQDLAKAEAVQATLPEGETILALLRQDGAEARAEPTVAPEERAAEDADVEANERLPGAPVPGQEETAETAGEAAPQVTEAFAALFEEIADGLVSTVQKARRSVDGLEFDVVALAVGEDPAPEPVAEPGEPEAAASDSLFGLSGIFALIGGADGALEQDTIAFRVADRVFEFEVVRVLESAIERIELALLGDEAAEDIAAVADGADADTDDRLAEAPDDAASEGPMPGDPSAEGPADGDAAETPAQPDPSEGVERPRDRAEEPKAGDTADPAPVERPGDTPRLADGGDGGFGDYDDLLPDPGGAERPRAPTAGREPVGGDGPAPAPIARPEPPAPSPGGHRDLPVVTLAEFDALMKSFAEQVGVDPLDLKPLSGQFTWLILDDNITDPSRGNVSSADIVWASVYVADLGVEAKFGGAEWDFAGFDL